MATPTKSGAPPPPPGGQRPPATAGPAPATAGVAEEAPAAAATTAPAPAPRADRPPPPPAAKPKPAPRTIGDAPAGTYDFSITRGRSAGVERVVLYGPGGIGKTSLAALMPKPLFLDLEDGTRHLDVARVPSNVLRDWDSLRAALHSSELWGDFDTVVVDSATKAEALAKDWVVANKPDDRGQRVDSIEAYGYGKGYQYLADTFLLLLADLDAVLNAGKNVVLIAHSCSEMTPNPMGEDYLRWEPDLYTSKSGKSSVRNRVVQWADHVLFVTYDVLTKKGERKGRGSGTRTIYPTELPSHVAKSRTLRDPYPYADENDSSVWRDLGCLR